MLRNILGLIAGIVVGVLVQAGVIYLVSLFLDIPVIASAAREEIAQAFASSPATALIAGIVSYLAAGFAAARTAGAISGNRAIARAAGAAVALMALVIAIMFPEPAWAQFGAFVAAVAGTMLGSHAVPARAEAGEDRTAATTDA